MKKRLYVLLLLAMAPNRFIAEDGKFDLLSSLDGLSNKELTSLTDELAIRRTCRSLLAKYDSATNVQGHEILKNIFFEIYTACIKNSEKDYEALKSAFLEADITKIKELLTLGADPNASKDGRPLLLDIVKAKDPVALSIVELLIKAGADVNKSDLDKKTALYEATLFGTPKMMELLLFHGAKVDLGERFFLTDLVKENTTESKLIEKVVILLNAGANADYALVIALEEKCYELVRVLLLVNPNVRKKFGTKRCGIDMDIWMDKDGQTALHVAADNDAPKEIIKLLYDHGANVKEYDCCLDPNGYYDAKRPIEYAKSEEVRLLLLN